MLRVARALRIRADRAGAALVINDRPHLAVAAGADGVHVGPDDGDLATVRAIVGPTRFVGRSTHSLDALAAAVVEDTDYVAFGPVWSTRNAGRDKGERGVEALRAARALVPAPIPLVAIGGIDDARLAEIRAAGVDAWAVIGAVAQAPDRVMATRRLVG